MTTPRAILAGFAMVAIAITFGPLARDSIVPPARASLDQYDFRMVEHGLADIANAIRSATRCR